MKWIKIQSFYCWIFCFSTILKGVYSFEVTHFIFLDNYHLKKTHFWNLLIFLQFQVGDTVNEPIIMMICRLTFSKKICFQIAIFVFVVLFFLFVFTQYFWPSWIFSWLCSLVFPLGPKMSNRIRIRIGWIWQSKSSSKSGTVFL